MARDIEMRGNDAFIPTQTWLSDGTTVVLTTPLGVIDP